MPWLADFHAAYLPPSAFTLLCLHADGTSITLEYITFRVDGHIKKHIYSFLRWPWAQMQLPHSHKPNTKIYRRKFHSLPLYLAAFNMQGLI